MRSLLVRRIRIVAVVIAAVALVILFRLYVVQVVRGDDFSARADRQYVRPQEGVFDRGAIYFEDKYGERVSAATIQSGYLLAINPTVITDSGELFDALAAHVDLDAADFLLRAAKENDPYEVVAKRLTREQADAVRALDLDEVYLHEERWRYYPGGAIASQALGFVAYDDTDELAGRYGLEQYYEDVLSREKDTAYINFFAEVFSNVADVFSEGKTKGAGDLVLTVEPTVQGFLESRLVSLKEEWGAKRVGGIVMNPQNGEIYAMGTLPNFNLNDFQGVPTAVFSNPLIENVHEMGSIVKPLTMAAGLDAGVVTADTEYDDTGSLTLNTFTISNYDGKARGVVPMQEVLNQSLNTGAAFVASEIGNQKFADYLFAYGLGTETGVDLPGEVPGLLSNLDSPRDIEYATASFGQGIAMTPIATARALATLANGGKLVTPHVVKEVDFEVGPVKKKKHELIPGVLKPETSEEITRMLVRVVDEALLGGTVKLDGYSVAAKTGTAQIASPDGGYYDDRFLHSFFGYFPAYDPQFLVFLYHEEPIGARYASQTLTHPFMDIVKSLIQYYEIPPDREASQVVAQN